ncbi:hypothetical protein wHmt_12870 [Wolbachia pipientis]|uniref:hypothetical protein n=1 Tax=Wolbachia pipientis TaxID=955 RepID=UPI00308AD25E|nr:hypothetical protein wHmt_12870 [Wolbachia pipientis]
MTSKDRNKRTNINRKLLDKIFSALEGVNIKQSKFVSKNQKEIKPEDTMPFPSRNVQINYGKGLDYIYGTKPLSNQADYPEGLNPFASALQKIKPSAEKLSCFKSAVVRAKSPNELHKAVDEVLASGARINACNDGEWSFAAVVLKVNRKIDVAVNKYLKFVWAYLFTAMLLLYRSSFRAILLSKQSTFSY